jgi:hypothetical protein
MDQMQDQVLEEFLQVEEVDLFQVKRVAQVVEQTDLLMQQELQE